MPTWRGGTYRFVVTSANATAGATYTNNTRTFTVTDTIAAGTVLFCTGTGAPQASGTLTKATGTGDATITFSSFTAPNGNWNTSTNWLTDGSGAGVPTISTNATFDNVSSACTIDIASALCRNLNFNSGTGYANTLNLSGGNSIIVGHSNVLTPNQSLTFSSTMTVVGTGRIDTRSNGTTTVTTNGFFFPNTLGLNVQSPAASATIVLTDNIRTSGLILGNQATVQSFSASSPNTITITNSLQIQTNSLTGGIAQLGTNSTTIILSGNVTWSQTTQARIGCNITINSPGSAVTISDGCSFGANGTNAFNPTLKYVAGTVIHNGTFHIKVTQNGPNQYIDVSGSTSTTATNTGTTGINFSNLTILSAASSTPNTTTITGNICVVNTFGISIQTGSKPPVILLGGTIYLNGSYSQNGYYDTTTSTTIIFQGTGTWSENLVLSSALGILSQGISFVINTTGTITLATDIGLAQNSSITYTAGNFITTSYTIRGYRTTLAGLGAGLQLVENFLGNYSGVNTASWLTITDTLPLLITNFTFTNIHPVFNNQFQFLGTAGFTTANLTWSTTPTSVNNAFIYLTAGSGIEYTITNSLSLIHIPFSTSISSSIAAVRKIGGTGNPKFTLQNGASQDVFYVNGGASSGDILDSSNGQTIWTRSGSVTFAINWQQWDYPKTQYGSFLI